MILPIFEILVSFLLHVSQSGMNWYSKKEIHENFIQLSTFKPVTFVNNATQSFHISEKSFQYEISTCTSVWDWNMVSHIMRIWQTEGI
jgi:hypothetical protein